MTCFFILGGGGGGGGSASWVHDTFGGGGGGGGAGLSAIIESIFGGGGGSFISCEKTLGENRIATTNTGIQKNDFLIKIFYWDAYKTDFHNFF